MSFSQEVKEELGKQFGQARHCRLAELSVLLWSMGQIVTDLSGKRALEIRTEHEALARKCFTLLKKTFNIETDVWEQAENSGRKGSFFCIRITGLDEYENILQAVKMWNVLDGEMEKGEQVSSILLKTMCCKRAFLRGSYLCFGSMSNPAKGYHLEYLCVTKQQAQQLCEIIADFDVEAKMIRRKKYFVVYIKEGAAIVELLNIMEAHISLMNLENERILKEIGNKTNREVNCEAANLIKSVNAANKQIDDILFIKENGGFTSLPDALAEVANVRLKYPDTPMKELGNYLDPPIGKSGVNHRLRKLSEIAEEMRNSI